MNNSIKVLTLIFALVFVLGCVTWFVGSLHIGEDTRAAYDYSLCLQAQGELGVDFDNAAEGCQP